MVTGADKKLLIVVFAVAAVGLSSIGSAQMAAKKHSFRGVVGVNTPEAGVNDQIVVRVREFDSWLVGQMRTKMILGEKYFDAGQFRRWLVLLDKVGKRDRDRFGLWMREHSTHLNLADPDADLLQAFDALRRDIWDGFYLVLGNSRLKHVRPRKPHDVPLPYGPDGVTFHDMVFILEKHPDDGEEWDKLSRGALHRVSASVRVGFDLSGAQFTLDTVVPPELQPPDTVVPEDQQAAAMASVSASSSGGGAAAMTTGTAAGRSVTQGQPSVRAFSFLAYGVWSMAIGAALVVLVFVAFLILAATTGMVRDPDLPRRGDAQNGRQFNLARCQTAFWFFLITAAYIFLGVVKGYSNTIITDQCLVLLGISTGTTLGSAFISKTARTGTPPLPPLLVGEGGFFRRIFWHIKRFFLEVLSDDAGKITFYRFQMAVWTLVLGSVFVSSVYRNLEMPQFGTNELALMGISAGTYLSFKFPEVKAAQAAKTAEPQPPAH